MELQEVHPKVSQTWYAKNAGADGIFQWILTHLEDIMVCPPHPPQGTFVGSNQEYLGRLRA